MRTHSALMVTVSTVVCSVAVAWCGVGARISAGSDSASAKVSVAAPYVNVTDFGARPDNEDNTH